MMSLFKKIIVVFILFMTVSFPITSAYSYNSYITANNQLIAKVSDEELSFFQVDYSGNVRTEFDISGAMSQAVDFLPFGAQPQGGAELANELGFQGMVFDLATELYTNYDPSISRFLNPNNDLLSVYDSQTLNPYSFMRNNPYRIVDMTVASMSLSPSQIQSAVEGTSVTGTANNPTRLNLELSLRKFDGASLLPAAQITGTIIGIALVTLTGSPDREPQEPVVIQEIDYQQDLPFSSLQPAELRTLTTTIDIGTFSESGDFVVRVQRLLGVEGNVWREDNVFASNVFGEFDLQYDRFSFGGIWGHNLQPGDRVVITVTLPGGFEQRFSGTVGQWSRTQ